MSGHEATTATDFFQVHHGIAVNGIDVSHWNGETPIQIPKFVQFMGIKAVDMDSEPCVNGVDPQFARSRELALENNIPYIAHYLYLRPGIPLKDQIYKLAETVGDLEDGECVEIDWEEDIDILDEEAFFFLDHLYGRRQLWYVNDLTPAMTAWMTLNRDQDVHALHHPNWNETNGWREAERWNAAVWQAGVGDVEGWANPIDINLILRPSAMGTICGWDLTTPER